jgi:hypothetical protein
VLGFGLIAISDIKALSAIGQVVAPGALLALVLCAAFAPRKARPRADPAKAFCRRCQVGPLEARELREGQFWAGWPEKRVELLPAAARPAADCSGTTVSSASLSSLMIRIANASSPQTMM